MHTLSSRYGLTRICHFRILPGDPGISLYKVYIRCRLGSVYVELHLKNWQTSRLLPQPRNVININLSTTYNYERKPTTNSSAKKSAARAIPPKQAEHDGPRVRPSRPSTFKQVPRNTAAPQQPGTVVRPP